MLKHLNPGPSNEEELRRQTQVEARALTREIDERFVATGILGVPTAWEEQKVKPKGLGSRAQKESTLNPFAHGHDNNQ